MACYLIISLFKLNKLPLKMIIAIQKFTIGIQYVLQWNEDYYEKNIEKIISKITSKKIYTT